MKRFHAHISVDDLTASTAFYSKLFGQNPSLSKPDYVKWMLDDPSVNFAISTRGHTLGLNHFGLQVDTEEELTILKQQAESAMGYEMSEISAETCCYSVSKKYWTVDPSGIPWEHFTSMKESQTFNDSSSEHLRGSIPATENTSSATHTDNQGSCC